jgi:hypothetical protein
MKQSHHVLTFPLQEEKLFTRKQVATRHLCTVETIKRREKAGLLRPLKIGRTIRHRLSDLIRFEKSSEV